LTKIYDKLRAQPVPVYNEDDGQYAVVSYEFLRGAIFNSFYDPYISWPPLAAALADLAQGDGKKSLGFNGVRVSLKPNCDTSQNEFNSGVEVMAAIACNGAREIAGDYHSIQEHLKHLLTMSEWGSVWERNHLMCASWPEIEQPRFQGPIGAVNTSNPILLIGNRHGM